MWWTYLSENWSNRINITVLTCCRPQSPEANNQLWHFYRIDSNGCPRSHLLVSTSLLKGWLNPPARPSCHTFLSQLKAAERVVFLTSSTSKILKWRCFYGRYGIDGHLTLIRMSDGAITTAHARGRSRQDRLAVNTPVFVGGLPANYMVLT